MSCRAHVSLRRKGDPEKWSFGNGYGRLQKSGRAGAVTAADAGALGQVGKSLKYTYCWAVTVDENRTDLSLIASGGVL